MKHSVLRGSDLHSPSNELVENNTGSTIPKFTAVTFSSMGTAYPQIVLANGATDLVRGITQTEITNGGVGYITALGFLNNVNTSILTVGTKLYAQASGVISSTSTGLPVGVVIKQDATAGIVYVENTGITRSDLSDLIVPDATTTLKGKIQLAGDLAGTADLPSVPGLATKEPTIVATTSADYYRGDKTFQTLDKTAVGLGNVDNTSDANKPVSTAQSTALSLKVDKAGDNLTGTLNSNGPVGSGYYNSLITTCADTDGSAQISFESDTAKQFIIGIANSLLSPFVGILPDYAFQYSDVGFLSIVNSPVGFKWVQLGSEIATLINGAFHANTSLSSPIVRVTGATASRVAVLDASKNIVSSSVTTTTLGYLDATSSVQTQIDSKTDNTQSIINALIFG